MTTFLPAYRTTVFQPRSVDPTESNPLVGNGVVHTDSFKVSTLPALSGFKPYLGLPQGRTGRIDFLARKTDIGQITLPVVDARMTAGGSNLTRWVTGFFSGASTALGRFQLAGNKVLVEESLDGGTTWANYFTGRIVTCTLTGALQYTLTVQGMTKDLVNAAVFAGRPHVSISYYAEAALLPVGPTANFGMITAPVPLTGVTDDGSQAQIFNNNGYTGGPFNVVLVQYSGEEWNLVTAGLLGNSTLGVQQGSSGPDPSNPLLGGASGGTFFNPTNAFRARITFLAGGTGEFLINAVGIVPRGNNKYGVSELVLTACPTTDPFYLALPGSATQITALTIRPPVGQVSAQAPIILADQHPVQVLADILDGKFGFLTPAGGIYKSYARNAAAFAALLADPSFGTARFIIPKIDKALAWIEKNLCQVFGIALYENASGEIVPVDVRLPASVGGLATLLDDDLDTATAPQWSADGSTAISAFDVKTYLDTPITSQDLWKSPDTFPTAPASLVTTTVQEFLTPFFGPGDAIDKTQSVDALGLRAMPKELLNGTLRTAWVGAAATGLAESYRRPYASAPCTTTLTCRRTATVNGLSQGGWALMALSKLPDPRTNLRGGTRLIRILEKSYRGPRVILTILDAGPNQAASTPTVGTLGAGFDPAHQITVPITLDAALDPVLVHIAVTPAGTVSAPAATSALWTFAARLTATGTVTIGLVPSGSRIFVRAQSVPNPNTYDSGLTSAWVTAATPYKDTTGITAATGLAVSAISGKTATLTWSVAGDIRHKVRVLLASGASQAAADAATPVRVVDLPAGSQTFLLAGLTQAQWFHPQIILIDGVGGQSTAAEATPKSFYANGANIILPPPAGMMAIPVAQMFAVTPAVSSAATPDGQLRTGYALNVLPGTLGHDLVVWEAPDVSGSPGTFVAVDQIPASRLKDSGNTYVRNKPATGSPLWVTLSARSATGDDSPTIPPIQVTPGPLPLQGLDGTSAAPLRRDRGMGGGRRTVSQLQSWLVPNGEFDLWETLSQPHAWALDLTAGATVAQDATGLASGDYALKWSCPNTTANTGWHGVSTNDPTVGAFCLPFRPGMRYRALLTSEVSRITEGQQFRITLDFGAGGTLQQAWAYTAAGAYDRYELVSFLVPLTASPNSKATIEFNGQGYTGGNVDFRLDSIRFDEETTDYETLARRDQTTAYGVSVNGDFEDGLRFWEIRSSGNHHITADTGTVYKGAKSLKITTTVNAATVIVQQSTRASDIDVSSVADATIRAVRVRQGDLLYVRGTMRVDTSGIGPTQKLGVTWWAGAVPTGAGTFQAVVSANSGTGGTWYTYEGFWQVPASVDWAAPAIQMVNQNIVDTIRVDELSIVRLAATHAVKVYLDTAVQVLANSLETPVNFVTEAFDQGSFWTAGAPTKLIIPGTGAQKYDGVYRLEGQIQFASNATGRRRARIRKNGATILGAHVENAVNGEDHTLQVVAEDANPAPGDYYELLAFQTSGGNLNLQIGTGATWFALHQLK